MPLLKSDDTEVMICCDSCGESMEAKSEGYIDLLLSERGWKKERMHVVADYFINAYFCPECKDQI
jgi:hypothetical protein